MQDTIGIYVHLPFCSSKCPYCDFFTIPYDLKIINKYTKKCIEELSYYANNKYIVDTIYFGGGTPSLMVDQVIEILNKIYNVYKIYNDPEITIELNPCSSNYSKLEKLKKAGINRLSIGVQSYNKSELIMLGRKHSIDQVHNIINNAKVLEFNNISVDIIIGLPNQTLNDLTNTLSFIENININHVSMYLLKIEESTNFYFNRMYDYLPCDEQITDLYLYACRKLEHMGFAQYEISNFAKHNLMSKHNLKYWQQKKYLGIGASAHSFLNNTRFHNIENIKNYLENNLKSNIVIDEYNPNKLHEYIIFNLRLKFGINIDELITKYKVNPNEEFYDLLKTLLVHNLIEINNSVFCLTKKGMLISNYIINKIIEKC